MPLISGCTRPTRLLHGHGTGDRITGGGEDDHEPVTQVLDLGATVLGDGLTQQAEMGVTQFFGPLLTEASEGVGRPHEIREEDRDDVCGAHRHPRPLEE